ncbi:DgyrCDS11443 [Dimorphilus gyrociliatus]|uniref:DgyrCDS11443 n=1 Tax=Dimorphilus gyrociliatus TaxID=2664684 RepID=A0A7I8W5W1_9ANNE|nr:DgyrCDS11443 [Dimorphilus gyrociliatus]
MSDYKEVTDFVKDAIPTKKRLLWSQLYSFVAKVSEAGYFFTISDSLIGYPLDNTYWCSKNSSGQPCPCGECIKQSYEERTYENCKHNNPATSSFWEQASYLFASTAEEQLTVMLNSTSWGMKNGKKIPFYPYFNKTTFGRVELPSLTKDKIKTLEVVLVAKPGQAVTETCKGDKSLYQIKDLLKQKGIEYKCVENPPYVMSLFSDDDRINKASYLSTGRGILQIISVLFAMRQMY